MLTPSDSGAAAPRQNAGGGKEVMEVSWTGPYSWPRFEPETGLPSVPGHPGVYLQTAEYRGGYVIYAAGITRRPIPVRLREHTRKYYSGDYTVLDIDALQACVREEVWHGWSWSPEKRMEFEKRKDSIRQHATRQLAGFRIFVANIGAGPRVLERLEAGIMHCLYRHAPPLCNIPDRGMHLAPRWPSEQPILVTNQCEAALHGLPFQFQI